MKSFADVVLSKMGGKSHMPPKGHQKKPSEDSTESSDWSEVEYGPGWDQVFDPSPANVTEQQMKST
jgi:hypothetical protein